MAKHTQIGKKGEEIARQYLERKQYLIIHTNYRAGTKEIDIIARKDNCVVFVEVKTRKNKRYQNDADRITPAKQQFLIEAAEHYFQQFQEIAEYRFDLISITFTRPYPEIIHIEDCFKPSW